MTELARARTPLLKGALVRLTLAELASTPVELPLWANFAVASTDHLPTEWRFFDSRKVADRFVEVCGYPAELIDLTRKTIGRAA